MPYRPSSVSVVFDFIKMIIKGIASIFKKI